MPEEYGCLEQALLEFIRDYGRTGVTWVEHPQHERHPFALVHRQV